MDDMRERWKQIDRIRDLESRVRGLEKALAVVISHLPANHEEGVK